MSNMSYCRFRNTLTDYLDCSRAINEYVEDAEVEPLSPDELTAAIRLIKAAIDTVNDISDMTGKDIGDISDGDIRYVLNGQIGGGQY